MKPYWVFVAALLMPVVVLADLGRLDPMGDALKIDPLVAPKGMHIMQILIQNQSLPLKGTGCSSDIPGDARTLQHRLALTLGDGIENKRHMVVVSGQCKTDKHELKPAMLIDIWRCSINVTEKTKRGSYIANASIDFSIKKDDWAMIPEKLLCM